MKEGTKKLIILLAAVLVMAGLLVLLTVDRSSCSEEEQEGEHEHYHEHVSDSDDVDWLLINRESDQCEKMVLTNSHGTYTISRSAATGELDIAELSGLPLNTGYIELVWYDMQSVGYSFIAAMPSGEDFDYAQFGLTQPQAVVTGSYSDGTTTKITIGNSIPSDEDSFYFMVDGYDGIYVSSFELSFQQGDQYWLADSIFSSGTQSVISDISITSENIAGGEMKITQHNSTDKSDPWYSYDWVISSPSHGAADNYSMSLLCDELRELVADEAMCAHPDSAQMAKYGMDSPYAAISHSADGVRHTLRLSRGDYSTLYCMADSIPVIYRLNADSYPVLSDLSDAMLRSPDLHVRCFDTIESMTVTAPNGTYNFRLERRPLSTDSTLFEYFAYRGDSELSLSSLKKLIEVFNGASASAYGDSAESDQPYAQVEIKYFESFDRADDVISYVPAGTRRYICRINGENRGTVTSLWLDKFLSDAEALSRGEDINV